MFDHSTRRAVAAQARAMRVEPAALMAVAEVESAGRATARVGGRDEPLIRFEGHYFHRLLPRAKRARAVKAGLASPKAGAILNPRTQKARWTLLGRARAIDREAADQSVSWGLGQVMGANWRRLGYGSVAELVEEARSGLAGQVRLMVRFIRAHGLDVALRKRDWRAFAQAYNGPAYARHDYHGRMARAYARHVRAGANAAGTQDDATADAPPPLRPPKAGPRWFDVEGERPVLVAGARGEAVRRVQAQLSLPVDGLYGSMTRNAVRRFQRDRGLEQDGVVGPDTWAALARSAERSDFRARVLLPLLAPFAALLAWTLRRR